MCMNNPVDIEGLEESEDDLEGTSISPEEIRKMYEKRKKKGGARRCQK